MPKAGNYEYPSRDFLGSINAVHDATTKAQTMVFTRDTFAEALGGLSSKSGGFGLLVSSIGMYGLADIGGGNIRITDLGKLILAGEPAEVEDAQNKAVRKVTLFADLYDRFGDSVTDEKIRIFLREKANVEVTEAISLASDIGKLLKKNLQFLRSAKVGEKSGQSGQPPAGGKKELSDRGYWELLTDNYGPLKIVDDLSAEYAIKMLQKFRERLASKTDDNAITPGTETQD